MPEYINPNNYVVHLTGPSNETIQVKPRQRIILQEYFDKYCKRGLIKRTNQQTEQTQPAPLKQTRINETSTRKQTIRQPIRPRVASVRKHISNIKTNQKKKQEEQRQKQSPRFVGRTINTNPNELLQQNLNNNNYPISNNIGIGILSYNRAHSLKRLIDSIIKLTDLRKTTVFISDDNSSDTATIDYINELTKNNNITVIKNNQRLGVAGNSNRLLRCLSRFKYGILLNDDVEIIREGWEFIYPDAMDRTQLHHMMYRQNGIYSADRGTKTTLNNVELYKIDSKPHGAVLAFTNKMLNKVGYFDTAYGQYGMEHVDWSMKAHEFGLNTQAGFFDVAVAEEYFVIHNEQTSIDDKQQQLRNARAVFENRISRYIEPNNESKVPSISYVVPIRNFERTLSIRTVVNNIRAQRYPNIDIIVVEQDNETRLNQDLINPTNYFLVPDRSNHLFNKSKAFNFGVSKAQTEIVVLHDADMLVQGHYTTTIAKTLSSHDACHLGGTVIYTTKEAMETINAVGIVDVRSKCERVVGYYEGGSLACRTQAFWEIGGFNEDFYGYGCEDCDFYARLSSHKLWIENRGFDLLHLWHSRVEGWDNHHTHNKQLEAILKEKSIPERILLQHQQLKRIGYNI